MDQSLLENIVKCDERTLRREVNRLRAAGIEHATKNDAYFYLFLSESTIRHGRKINLKEMIFINLFLVEGNKKAAHAVLHDMKDYLEFQYQAHSYENPEDKAANSIRCRKANVSALRFIDSLTPQDFLQAYDMIKRRRKSAYHLSDEQNENLIFGSELLAKIRLKDRHVKAEIRKEFKIKRIKTQVNGKSYYLFPRQEIIRYFKEISLKPLCYYKHLLVNTRELKSVFGINIRNTDRYLHREKLAAKINPCSEQSKSVVPFVYLERIIRSME